MTSESWQARKGLVNHRFFHNMFILSLRAAQTELASSRLTPEAEDELVYDVLPRWPELRDDIQAVVRAFERAMSPGSLFSCEPLSKLPAADRHWLSRLVAGLWRERNRVEQLLEDCSLSLVEADRRHSALVEGWRSMAGTDRLGALGSFIDACVKVSGSLSALPSGHRGV